MNRTLRRILVFALVIPLAYAIDHVLSRHGIPEPYIISAIVVVCFVAGYLG